MKPNALLAIVVAIVAAAVSLSLAGCGGPPSYAEALQTFTAEREQLEYIQRERNGLRDELDRYLDKMNALREKAKAYGLSQQVTEIDDAIAKTSAEIEAEMAKYDAPFDRQIERVKIAKADLEAAEKRRK